MTELGSRLTKSISSPMFLFVRSNWKQKCYINVLRPLTLIDLLRYVVIKQILVFLFTLGRNGDLFTLVGMVYFLNVTQHEFDHRSAYQLVCFVSKFSSRSNFLIFSWVYLTITSPHHRNPFIPLGPYCDIFNFASCRKRNLDIAM